MRQTASAEKLIDYIAMKQRRDLDDECLPALGTILIGRTELTASRFDIGDELRVRTLVGLKPKSGIQTSAGLGLIDQVQHFLLDLARPSDVEKSPVGQPDEFDEQAPNLFRTFRAPLLKLLVESFRQRVHRVAAIRYCLEPLGPSQLEDTESKTT
jgi:hypothetical protein